jgi:hypothetical protein
VPLDPATAFDLWVDHLGDWWPVEHTIGSSPKVTARMERGVGGAVVDVAADGTESRWGTIPRWEPPHRLVVAWQITAQWRSEPDLARSSEYEVCFTAVPPGRTRVDVEHRHLARHGDGGGTIRSAVDSPGGWPSVLAAYADAATRSAPADR